MNPLLLLPELPEWIVWIGQDANGWWWRFGHAPDPGDYGWQENNVGSYRKIAESAPPPDWQGTLQRLR